MWLMDCLDFFPGVDRTVGGFQGLEEAQEKLRDEKVKMEFAAHYQRLHKAWEVVSPDVDIIPLKTSCAASTMPSRLFPDRTR